MTPGLQSIVEPIQLPVEILLAMDLLFILNCKRL